MPELGPGNAADIRKVVESRLGALDQQGGIQETATVEWRGEKRNIPVISMPVDLLYYNPDTHRIRAQRSLDPPRDAKLRSDPFGVAAQAYLHELLVGDPTEPTKKDSSFEALKEDLNEHGQNDPGITTRAGVLINGNTRRAALKELGQQNMRVGVLPPDAGFEDLRSIELSLQLRKDHRREYSFMNLLLAIDERARGGHRATQIQADFHMRPSTYDRNRWILAFVQEAIDRSRVEGPDGKEVSMRLIDFETDQGKLDELYRAYTALKARSPDEADALREQRLLAIALNKSKTDLRLIDSDFTKRYMKVTLPAPAPNPAPPATIPGTSIIARGPSQEVEALKALTTNALRAKAVQLAPGVATGSAIKEANNVLGGLEEALESALERAGKNNRVKKKRLAAADRLSDVVDDLELALAAVADARSTGNFDPEDLDEVLLLLRQNMLKLGQLVTRNCDSNAEGIEWLRSVASLAIMST